MGTLEGNSKLGNEEMKGLIVFYGIIGIVFIAGFSWMAYSKGHLDGFIAGIDLCKSLPNGCVHR